MQAVQARQMKAPFLLFGPSAGSLPATARPSIRCFLLLLVLFGDGDGTQRREAMSKPKQLLSTIMSIFSSRTQVGVDKAGNRYFTRTEQIDGTIKERRWVVYKADRDPTSVPVEWICWLNGQRKRPPTPQELVELEARRERVKQNIELLKKREEEERKSLAGQSRVIKKSDSPDLKSFMKQFPDLSLDQIQGARETTDPSADTKTNERSSEPTGSGASYRPGTWQPPS